jgi:integrase
MTNTKVFEIGNRIETNGTSAIETHEVIDLNVKKARRSTATHTARGVKKAQEDEPIRTLEHIKEAQEYYRTKGKSKWHRARNYMLFTLGISVGIRGGDLLSLRIGDVLNEDGTVKDYIWCIESKTRKTNQPHINDTAKKAILEYIALLDTVNFDDYLILSERKGRMDESQLYRILHKLNTDLGFEEHIGAHSLRKTFGYWNLKLHPNDMQALAVIQDMLNHSSSQTTLRYCGITREDKDKYYNEIQAIFEA